MSKPTHELIGQIINPPLRPAAAAPRPAAAAAPASCPELIGRVLAPTPAVIVAQRGA